jgi:RNA recognition motif-containing protein
MNIYIGNLSFTSNEDTLHELFSVHGEVTSVKIITDPETGRSRGFGFVEMPNDTEAQAAIAALNNFEFEGRPIKVNEARPRQERGSDRQDRRRFDKGYRGGQ